MLRRLLLRLTLILAGCAFAATASAAGSLTIVQESVSPTLGTWTLHMPGPGTAYGGHGERERVLQDPPAGSYTLTVFPPQGAETSITVRRSGAPTVTTRSTTASFDVPPGTTARVVITYSYNGVVRVESSIPGSSFVLTAENGFHMTGTAPAVLPNMPPLTYVAHFGLVSGCATPSPVKRSLGTNLDVTFTAQYRCPPPTATRTLQQREARSPESTGGLRLVHHLSQAEVLPGGMVRVTLGARNMGTTTLRGITIAETFDPQALSTESIRDGGSSTGNGAIVWNIDRILAGQTWSTTFVVRADTRVPAGTVLTLTARASGDALDATPLSHLAATATLGVVQLPATGMPADAIFLGITGLLAAAPAVRFRRR